MRLASAADTDRVSANLIVMLLKADADSAVLSAACAAFPVERNAATAAVPVQSPATPRIAERDSTAKCTAARSARSMSAASWRSGPESNPVAAALSCWAGQAP
jgi:hypothetical protein